MDMGHDHTPDMAPDSASSMSMSMMPMQMSFYWGKHATILFKGWQTTSVGTYLPSLLALLVIAFLYQYLERLTSSASPLISHGRSARPHAALADGSKVESNLDDDVNHDSSTPLTTKLLLTLLFCARIGLAYLLMLAIMSFNAGIFIAVVLGLSAGFFVFRSDIHSPSMASASPVSAPNSHASTLT